MINALLMIRKAQALNDKEPITKTKILTSAGLDSKNINKFESISNIPVAAFEKQTPSATLQADKYTTFAPFVS